MMDECLEYLEKRAKTDSSFTYEVIIVDDGSRDKTTQVGLGYGKKYGTDKVRVLTLAKNRGKGGAVRMVRYSFLHCLSYDKSHLMCTKPVDFISALFFLVCLIYVL